MSVENYWGDPCPVCKKPITDRDSPYAVVCGACIADALATVLARAATDPAKAPPGAVKGGG